MRRMPITAVLGEQRGDEGKGRFADMLAAEHDIVARFNGGANAGHTVVLPDGTDLALHLMPSGIAHDHTVNVIGNGTAVDPIKLADEITDAAKKGIDLDERRLMISSGAHLIFPHHISLDEIREAGTGQQGSTKSGIAHVYSDKALRVGLRMEAISNDIHSLREAVFRGIDATNLERVRVGLDLINPLDTAEEYLTAAMSLGKFVTDTALYLRRRLQAGDRLLAEGAQAFLLDLDHGMHPAVTSSSTSIGGVFTGLGVAPHYLERVLGVSKAVPSHVGGGPFATEIHDAELLTQLHGDMTAIDAETGTTTGRVRRLGHLDIPAIRRAQMVNGTTEMAITKLDWVPRYGETALVCVGYERKGKIISVAPDAAYKIEQSKPHYAPMPTWQEDISDVREFGDLPKTAQEYVEFVEILTGTPVTMIGVGPRRDQVIMRDRAA